MNEDFESVVYAWDELLHQISVLLDNPGFILFVAIVFVAAIVFGAKTRKNNLSKSKPEVPSRYRVE